MIDFNIRMKELINEVKNLKTSTVKTAATLKIQIHSTELSFPMVGNYGKTGELVSVSSKQTAIITINHSSENKPLSMLTLNATTLDGRDVDLLRSVSGDGFEKFEVWIPTGNDTDKSTIAGGGSVTLNYQVDITCTDDFAISVEYEDN